MQDKYLKTVEYEITQSFWLLCRNQPADGNLEGMAKAFTRVMKKNNIPEDKIQEVFEIARRGKNHPPIADEIKDTWIHLKKSQKLSETKAVEYKWQPKPEDEEHNERIGYRNAMYYGNMPSNEDYKRLRLDLEPTQREIDLYYWRLKQPIGLGEAGLKPLLDEDGDSIPYPPPVNGYKGPKNGLKL